MKPRYSRWLGDMVYDMTERQEKYLTEYGFEIKKPELVSYNDGEVRDIPHSIIWEENDLANLRFDRKDGTFYININKGKLTTAKDVEALKGKLDLLARLIQTLQELD